jgi:hypothetical protein
MATVIEHNATTGEIIKRQMTSDELSNLEKFEIEEQKKIIEAEARAVARQVLLDKLGITADEAKLLLG